MGNKLAMAKCREISPVRPAGGWPRVVGGTRPGPAGGAKKSPRRIGFDAARVSEMGSGIYRGLSPVLRRWPRSACVRAGPRQPWRCERRTRGGAAAGRPSIARGSPADRQTDARGCSLRHSDGRTRHADTDIRRSSKTRRRNSSRAESRGHTHTPAPAGSGSTSMATTDGSANTGPLDTTTAGAGET